MFASDAATPDDVAAFFRDNYPDLMADDTELILARYPQLPALPFHKPWFPTNSLAYGEATFICPSLNLLKQITSASASAAISGRQHRGSGEGSKGRIFAYRYNVRDAVNAAAGVGVPHIFEAAAVFGPRSLPPSAAVAASYYTYNAAVVPVVMAYWTSFVRALDPSVYRAAGAPVWECWDGDGGGGGGGGGAAAGTGVAGGRRLKIETNDTCMEAVDPAEAERCAFWEGMAWTMRQRRRRMG